jgi:hypothetical protein
LTFHSSHLHSKATIEILFLHCLSYKIKNEVCYISAALAKAASEKDLNQISECIGSNWEMLAPFLIERNSAATVEQIKEDHRQSRQRVYALLCKWRAQTDDPSLAHLFHSMYQAGTSVTIDWSKIADKLKVPIQDIRACKLQFFNFSVAIQYLISLINTKYFSLVLKSI